MIVAASAGAREVIVDAGCTRPLRDWRRSPNARTDSSPRLSATWWCPCTGLGEARGVRTRGCDAQAQDPVALARADAERARADAASEAVA